MSLTTDQESTIHLVLKLRGAGPQGWRITIFYGGQHLSLYTDGDAIADIKLEIHFRYGIPPRKQILRCNGSLVTDSKTTETKPSLCYCPYPSSPVANSYQGNICRGTAIESSICLWTPRRVRRA